MPSLKKHIQNSKFRKIHKWLDGKDVSLKQRIVRHIPTKQRINFVKNNFNESTANEYIDHIKKDYKSNFLFRSFLNIIGGIQKWKTRKT